MSSLHFSIEPELELQLRARVHKKGDISKIMNQALRRFLETKPFTLSKEDKILLEVFAEDLYKQYGVLEEITVQQELEERYKDWVYSKILEATKFICMLKRN